MEMSGVAMVRMAYQFIQGGIMRLFLEDNRVRFSVDQRSADRAGLQISSRLLRLAGLHSRENARRGSWPRSDAER